MVKLVALYKKPDDPAAFDKHYSEIHAPLAAKMPGLRKMEVAKVSGELMGQIGLHLIAEMYFDDQEAGNAAMKSPEGRASGKDLMTFAGKYVTLCWADVQPA